MLIACCLIFLATPFAETQQDKQKKSTALPSEIKITTHTSLLTNFVFRDKAINEVQRWSIMAVPLAPPALTAYSIFNPINPPTPGERKSENFFSGLFNISTNISILENLKFVFELENRVIDRGENIYLGRDNLQFYFEQAYMEFGIPEFMGSTLRFGVQDIKHAIRQKGDALVLDVSESEPAFDLINQTLHFLPRDTIEAVGVRLTSMLGDFSLDVFSCATIEGGHPDLDELLSGLILDWKIAPKSKASFLLFFTKGGGGDLYANLGVNLGKNPDGTRGKNQLAATIGGGVSLVDIIAGRLEFFAEGYLQRGSAGRRNPAGTPKDVIYARGFAYRVGLHWLFEDVYGQPWVELSHIFYSGDRNIANERDSRFLSYENVDEFLIVENNEYGLDIDTNYYGIKAAYGMTLKIMPLAPRIIEPMPHARAIRPEGLVDIAIRGGFFRLPKLIKYTNLMGELSKVRDIGAEIDLDVNTHITKDISFILQGGILFSSEFLEVFTQKQERSSFIIISGLGIKI